MFNKIKIIIKFISLSLQDIKWTISSKLYRYFNGQQSREIIEWQTDFPEFSSSIDITNFLSKNKISYNEGNHTIYIPPQKNIKMFLREVIDFYPQNSGFKILKHFGGPKTVNYFGNHDNSSIRLMMRKEIIGNPLDQIKVANYLYYKGIGPKIYDIAAFQAKNTKLSVFVLDNIEQNKPSLPQCKSFITKLENIMEKTPLGLVISDWKERGDFNCPNCNNNLFVNKINNKLHFNYVDFQNFFLHPANGWLSDIVSQENKTLSFGNNRLWRGSKYLYQSIENANTSAKRNTDKRWNIISKILKKEGDSISNRIILDIGCNAGMFMQKPLFEGALWSYGWDLPEVAQVAEEILYSLGESRFTIFKTNLNAQTKIKSFIPNKHHHFLEESIVFYLSIRGHIGVIEELKKLNCRFFVYEGHQEESLSESKEYMKDILQNKMYVFHQQYLSDGDSYKRPLLILRSRS
jgi:hypothetical protein